jgi:hypothetical protein
MEDLISKVKATEKTKSKWRNNHSSEEWINASNLNKLLFGIGLSRSLGCECLEDLFFYISRNNVKQQIETKMEKRFILKKGKLFQGMAYGQVGEQSSDEQMMRALKASPGLVVHFKSVPENWKELCGIDSDSKPVKAKSIEEPKSSEENDIDEKTSNENDNASVTLGREELEKLKVSQLRSLLDERGIEIPETITRKAELIGFIIEKI